MILRIPEPHRNKQKDYIMKFSQRYISFISDRRTAAFGVMGTALVGAVLSSIDNRISGAAINLVSLQLSFSEELFRSYMSRMSDATLQQFVQYLRLDIIFALCYALTLSSVLSSMWLHLTSLYENKPPVLAISVFRVSLFLPSIAAAFNIGEDILLYAAARLGYTQSPIIPIQSSMAAAKYVFLIGALASIMGILIMRRRKMKGR
jgi:hypothetical protein